MRLSMCVGEYAKNPYCVPGVNISVYSMEELCYCIHENAFLIDTSIMNDELVDWIDRECGMRKLAKALYSHVHKRGLLSSFVVTLFDYVGLYEKEETDRVEQVLKQGAGLNRFERRKSQIDFLVKKKKYLQAIQEYDAVIKIWKEEERQGEVMPSDKCLASIIHNKAVALTGLMIYKVAAECFYEAYQLDKREDYYRDYLACKRMQLPEREYITFAAGVPEAFDATLGLEKDLEQLNAEWEQQVDFLRLNHRREMREGVDKQKYYDENEIITQSLKSCYRSMVSD